LLTRPFDVAVVLGAAVGADGQASPALLRRVAYGVDLYDRGVVGHLLMSGGGLRPGPTEAELMRRAALTAGVPDEAVVIEDRSRNTLENARFSRLILEERRWQRVLLVTDRHHLRRALYTFRRFGVAAEGAAPPPPAGLGWGPHLRELGALLCYLWRVERALWRAARQ
jgi:uncharacterized SAM-binding protein YcdF (DUF218 family)